MIEQDFSNVQKHLDAAARFYGYGSFDASDDADIEKIMRLAELIQTQVHEAEFALLDRLNAPVFDLKKGWCRLLSFFGRCAGFLS